MRSSYSRARKGSQHVSPEQLLEMFGGDGFYALAAGVLISGIQDHYFVRSKWFNTICNALDLDCDLWRDRVRAQAKRTTARAALFEKL